MTPNEFRAIVAAIELRNPPFACELAVHNSIGDDAKCELHVMSRVTDRDTGRLDYITHSFSVPPDLSADRARAMWAVEWVFACVGQVFRHELRAFTLRRLDSWIRMRPNRRVTTTAMTSSARAHARCNAGVGREPASTRASRPGSGDRRQPVDRDHARSRASLRAQEWTCEMTKHTLSPLVRRRLRETGMLMCEHPMMRHDDPSGSCTRLAAHLITGLGKVDSEPVLFGPGPQRCVLLCSSHAAGWIRSLPEVPAQNIPRRITKDDEFETG